MMVQERYSSPQAQRSAGVSVVASSTVTRRRSQSTTTSERTALVQSYYEDAKRQITQALSVDERGERMEALELYNKALTTLQSGLAKISGDDLRLKEIQGKMEKMKEQVKSRMEVLLQVETAARRDSAQSTSKTADSTTGKTALADSVTGSQSSMSQSVSDKKGSKVETRADLLFSVDTEVGLFCVDSQEHVKKYEDVDAMSVFRYRESIPGQPPAFLQCGDFVYPLVPGKSPVLKASDHVYMFPELKDGSSVGIVLGSASEEELRQLDHLLSLMTDFRVAEDDTGKQTSRELLTEDKETPTWGATVAGGIDRGVNWVSEKISQGAEAAGNLIAKGATKLRGKIEPNEKPTEIPDSVQKGVHVTNKATGYVVSVSDYLMTSLAKLTLKVGKEVKDKVAESETMKRREVNPHAKEAWKVTKSSLKGAAAVFVDLEKGAITVIESLSNETAKTVEHKYGESAGKVTDNSLHATINVATLAHTYSSWKRWGIQFLAKVSEADDREGKTGEREEPKVKEGKESKTTKEENSKTADKRLTGAR